MPVELFRTYLLDRLRTRIDMRGDHLAKLEKINPGRDLDLDPDDWALGALEQAVRDADSPAEWAAIAQALAVLGVSGEVAGLS